MRAFSLISLALLVAIGAAIDTLGWTRSLGTLPLSHDNRTCIEKEPLLTASRRTQHLRRPRPSRAQGRRQGRRRRREQPRIQRRRRRRRRGLLRRLPLGPEDLRKLLHPLGRRVLRGRQRGDVLPVRRALRAVQGDRRLLPVLPRERLELRPGRLHVDVNADADGRLPHGDVRRERHAGSRRVGSRGRGRGGCCWSVGQLGFFKKELSALPMFVYILASRCFIDSLLL